MYTRLVLKKIKLITIKTLHKSYFILKFKSYLIRIRVCIVNILLIMFSFIVQQLPFSVARFIQWIPNVARKKNKNDVFVVLVVYLPEKSAVHCFCVCVCGFYGFFPLPIFFFHSVFLFYHLLACFIEHFGKYWVVS